jgi:tetratricopeptide (TPR) repeat protein
MKPFVLVLAGVLLSTGAAAQRHKIGEINTETEEGKLLQAIGTENDAARKLTLMETFVGKFGNHEAAGWVWSQLQPAYAKAGNHEKALGAGERLLALDPMDISAAYGNLKAAEARKDSEAVVKWAVTASEIARKTAQEPKKPDEEEDDHKRAVDFAKQVDTYTEYSLYANALTETDPAKVMKLAETLEQRSPQSQYVAPILTKYAWAAREAKAVPNAVTLGERAYARNQFNEDLLLAMADYYMNQKAPDKTVQYSTKLLEVIESKPKPEGVSDSDWDRKKTMMAGVAHWMAGTTYSTQSKYSQADKELRAALPLIRDNDQLLAGALFHLGLANYQMGKGKSAQQLGEAVKFMQQCAAIKSPFQAQAQKNLTVMRRETGQRK